MTQADVFLFLGDNIYQAEETNDINIPHLKEAYRLLARSAPFAQLRRHTPVLPIWDDHDFGMNDAGGSWLAKVPSERLFEQVWAIGKSDARTQRPGIYFSQTVGPVDKRVQFIMLDTRFFRSDVGKFDQPVKGNRYRINTDPATTMLGKQQWQWLEQQLKIPAKIRFVASSVQMLVEGGRGEGWYTMPHERQRLLDLLSHSSNVILLSGDRHFSRFYGLEHQGKTLIEFTSSSMNLPTTGKPRTKIEQQPESYQIGKAFFDVNFGVIDIDWQQHNINLQIKNAHNQTVAKKTITFAQ